MKNESLLEADNGARNYIGLLQDRIRNSTVVNEIKKVLASMEQFQKFLDCICLTTLCHIRPYSERNACLKRMLTLLGVLCIFVSE